MIERVAITGSSGYYGRKLLAHLRQKIPNVRILGIDVVPPMDAGPDEFRQLDIRDPSVGEALAAFRPDTILHFAFVLNPIHDEALMHDVNVRGTANVFDAVRALKPERFLMSSSATAYGAWPNNPVPMDETCPLRPAGQFRYALDKALLEERLRELANELPEVAISWTRPTIIAGDEVNNVVTRLMLRPIAVIKQSGDDTPLQLVHEEDLVAATWEILKHNARGPFNIAPNDYIRLSEIAERTHRPLISMPAWLLSFLVRIGWTLRIKRYGFPPSMCPFFRHPWVIAATRLQRELGFQFHYSTKESLEHLWQSELKYRATGKEHRVELKKYLANSGGE